MNVSKSKALALRTVSVKTYQVVFSALVYQVTQDRIVLVSHVKNSNRQFCRAAVASRFARLSEDLAIQV